MMKSRIMIQSTILTFLITFLTGCLFTPEDDKKQAGIDDFDNMVHAFIEKGDQWDEQVAPKDGVNLLEKSETTQPPFLKTSSGALLQPNSTLFKGFLLDSLIRFDFSDTADGLLYVTFEKTDTGWISKDSAVIRYDDKAKDAMTDNENIISWVSIKTFSDGRRVTGIATDADGDGIINVVDQNSKVRIQEIKDFQGEKEHNTFVASAGPDLDMDRDEDNVLYLASSVTTSGGDTLIKAVYSDEDGDGILYDKSSGDTSRVRLDMFSTEGNEDNAVQVTAVLLIDIEPNGHQILRAASYHNILEDGTTNSARVLSLNGDSIINPYDTVAMELISVPGSDQDENLSLKSLFTMSLGSDWDDDTDNILYKFEVEAQRRNPPEDSAYISFTPLQALPHGENPEYGTLKFRVEYDDGSFRQLTGKNFPEGLSGDFIDRNGKSYSVKWNNQGTLVLYEES